MQNNTNYAIRQGIDPVLSTISIPIRLVLSSISESEASGSALVTPVQSRKRATHGLPLQHPHRRRKVSAPPELQPHFGGPTSSPSTPHHGGANPSSVDNAGHSDYIFSLTPSSCISEGIYGGSDSGVTSEYSSYAHPVIGIQRQGTSSPDDDLTSPVDSIDELEDHRSGLGRSSEPKYYTSDSECESSDMNSPPQRRKSGGVTNSAYVNTETNKSVTVSVGGPPPLSRSHTDTNITSPVPSITGSVMPEPRRNSMVVQLSLANQQNAVSNIMPRTRSISMVSLNTAGSSANNHSMSAYPNLASLRAPDTQSIYSEVGNNNSFQPNYQSGYMNTQGLEQNSGNPPPDHNDEPESTTPERKREWFFSTLSENLSLMYGIFLFIFAIVIYLADTFSGHDSAMAEGFNVYLIVVQLLWLGYVHVDVRRYLKKISLALENARESNAGKTDPVQLEPTADGQYQLRINVPERQPTISQDYGFTTGRHGGSLYLKIGATVFCFGHLIHAGLTLGQKILYLTEDDPAFKTCTCAPDVIMSVLQPIYAFYQLFFIFKYSNLIINRRKLLTRFALMHCIASSLCFWVYTILQETLQALFAKKSYDYGSNYSSDAVTGHTSPLTSGNYANYGYEFDDMSDEMDDMYEDDDDDSMKKVLASAVKSYSSSTSGASTWSINYGCEKTTNLTQMINYTTPYLYPFSIEYNILIVGIWILLWENIGRIDRHTHIPSVEVTYEEDNSKAFSSNMIIYVDCHSSNRGLFAGLLVTVATVISIILFFIFTSEEENKLQGLYVNGYSELFILIVMGVAAILAFAAVRHLDILQHSISSVDDILLFICLPCIFLYAFFSMVPSIEEGQVLFVSVNMLQVVQSVLQTALICDGLRRCSNSSELQQKKLGREVITFLVVANVAMWLLETFEIKSEEGNSKKYEYYGKELWTITSHLTLPLALFYRFHSSVCLADMWKASYEPEPEH